MTSQVAFLFPGQGSQTVGMGLDAYQQSAAARRVFAAFDDTLAFPLSQLCFNGPEDTLRSTINAQPAIVAVSLAYLAAFQEALSPQSSSWSFPLAPSYTAGHSVGECTALVVAGALDLSETAFLVRERGRLMHEEEVACPGSMAAIIGLDDQTLQHVCQEATIQAKEELEASPSSHPGLGAVVVANYNAPGQIVLSGELRALEIASKMASARGAKRVLPLAVSGAFHSPVMAPAVEPLSRSVLQVDLHDATIPIISNITAAPLVDAAQLRKELAEQIAASVQWTRTIEYLSSVGVTTFFEIGPGKALAGMIKRIVKGASIITIGSMLEVEQAVTQVRAWGLLS